MKTTITKTNLSEVNNGHCRSRNNARYSGRTPMFRVKIDDPNDDDHNWAANKRWLAEDFANWVETSGWDGKGDAEMHFAQSANAARYLASEHATLILSS
jgi:hypothetical protein